MGMGLAASQTRCRSMTETLLMQIGRVLASLVCVLMATWTCLAFWYQLPLPATWKITAGLLVAAFSLLTLTLTWIWQGHAIRGLLLSAAAFSVVLVWWHTILPSQHRPWADDVARQLQYRLDGSLVTLENVRNFEWRSDTDYRQRWETRQYDLARLKSVDVAVSYWTLPVIAHTLVSFGFDDGRYLTFSIEIRRERNESFSSVGGFFKQFETSLVAADEHDILRVRTNVRGEDVYLYRTRLSRDQMRSLFLAYLAQADSLTQAPRFYNTLTANCTTIVYELARRVVPGLPMDYRLLASGYLPAYLHDVGALAPGLDLATLRSTGRITARAIATDAQPGVDFSTAIRVGMHFPAQADR